MLLAELKSTQSAWVILYTKNKLVLGKRSPQMKNANQWNFFGGGVDEGEDPREAAVRELREETGYSLSSSALKHITTIGSNVYFSAKITDPENVHTSDETSMVGKYRLTDLPDNLHAKTATFFDQLDTLFQ
jgi:8-oxo-dGTP pyrophosphatase MutT (NUDIX family)